MEKALWQEGRLLKEIFWFSQTGKAYMLIEVVWIMEVNPVILNYIHKVNSYSKPLLFYVLSSWGIHNPDD